jgi:glucokinase
LARAGAGPGGPDVRDLAERALAGDAFTRALFTGAYRALGRALAPWVVRFGASLVVLGGSVAASWALVAGPFQAGLADGRAAVHVIPASSAHAGLVGAGWWVYASGTT